MRSIKLNDVEEGMKTLREMMDLGKRPVQYYQTILHMCVRSPVPWLFVGELLQQMEVDGVELDECGYTALVKMHMNEGDYSAALTLLEKMVAIPASLPKRRTLLPVLQGCARKGDLAALCKVIDIYKRIHLGLQSEEFAAMVFVCTMRGDRKTMSNVLGDM
jgi:pentatricopeptide repeat protein